MRPTQPSLTFDADVVSMAAAAAAAAEDCDVYRRCQEDVLRGMSIVHTNCE